MIDFKDVWLPQLISYARLISSGQLEAEWLGRVAATTSVTDPDELYEQVFDDLDADGIWAKWRDHNAVSAEGRDAVDRFLQALREIEQSDARILVQTDHWERAKQAAQAVTSNVR
jgi:hypothetical protein